MTQAEREAVDEETLRAIEALVRMRSGMVFSHSRRDALLLGISEALDALKLSSAQALLHHFQTSPQGEQALHELVLSLTVGETYFWRNRPQFDALEKVILPDILRRCPASSPVNVWSAACSTGEEPYSLAILLSKLLDGSDKRTSNIFATDLNPLALEGARLALYPAWSFRDTPEGFQARYFDPVGARWQLKPELRRSVHFRLLNLMQPETWAKAGIEHQDLILCRNVLIYFDEKGVEKVLHGLHGVLNPGGWLVLGHADAFSLATRLFSVVTLPGAIVYQKQPPTLTPVRSSQTVSGVKALGPEPGAHSGHARSLAPLPPPGRTETRHGSGSVGVPKSTRPTPGVARKLEPAVPAPHGPSHLVSGPRHSQPLPANPPKSPDGSRIEPILKGIRDRQVENALGRLAVLGSRDKLSLPEMLQVAEALADQHFFDEAEAWCGRILAQDSQSAHAHYLLGILRLGRGRLGEALQALRRAVYLQPGFLLARMSLSEALMRAGETQRARKELDVILEHLAAVPENSPVPGSSGLTMRQLRMMVEARQRL